MPVIVDDTGNVVDGGGELPDAEDPYTYLGGDDTVHSFGDAKVEQATRFAYRADESGVVYTILASGEALNNPGVIQTVAGQLAHQWNINATVPGVVDIAETQITKPLGGLDDAYDIAVISTNGKTPGVLQLEPADTRTDVFAEKVAAYRKTLDAFG